MILLTLKSEEAIKAEKAAEEKKKEGRYCVQASSKLTSSSR